jgi:hypothetical protein
VIQLRLLSRPDCHLCEAMRAEVEALLGKTPREWEVVDVGGDAELSRRYGNEIPVLFVNGRLFAKGRLPRLAARLRLLRAAGSTRTS